MTTMTSLMSLGSGTFFFMSQPSDATPPVEQTPTTTVLSAAPGTEEPSPTFPGASAGSSAPSATVATAPEGQWTGQSGIPHPTQEGFMALFKDEFAKAAVGVGFTNKDIQTIASTLGESYYGKPSTGLLYDQTYANQGVKSVVNATREVIRRIIKDANLVAVTARLLPGNAAPQLRSDSVYAQLRPQLPGMLANAAAQIKEGYGLEAPEDTSVSVDLVRASQVEKNRVASVTTLENLTPGPGYGRATNVHLKINKDVHDPQYYKTGEVDQVMNHEWTHAIMGLNMNWADMKKNHRWFSEAAADFLAGKDNALKAMQTQIMSNLRLDGNAAKSKLANILAKNPIDGAHWDGSHRAYATGYAAIRYLHAQIKEAGGKGIIEVMNYLKADTNRTLDDAFSYLAKRYGKNLASYTTDKAFLAAFNTHGAEFIVNNMNLNNEDNGSVNGADASGKSVQSNRTLLADRTKHVLEHVKLTYKGWPM